MPMFGLPRSRTLHPDKQLALKRMFKPQPKRRYMKKPARDEGSKLIKNLAYQLHSQRTPPQTRTPGTRRTGPPPARRY